MRGWKENKREQIISSFCSNDMEKLQVKNY